MTRIVWLLCVVISMSSGCYLEQEDHRPNILMISIDDLNTFLNCMGYDVAYTPNIDRLAAQGVLFTNAHCQAPLCGPSRASVMTGLRPSTTGIYGQIKDENLLKASAATKDISLLPQYFKDHGYYTMGVGKIFHQHAPEGLFHESGGRVKGFGPKPSDGKYFKWSKKGTSTDWGAFPDKDIEMPDYLSTQWAVDRLNKDYNSPFFMAVGFLRPHVPWYVPRKWFDMYDTAQITTPPYLEYDFEDIPAIVDKIDDMPMYPSTQWAIENGEWKNIVQAYLACVSFVDFYVGEILKVLENSQYADNTIVVLWSDHGYRLGEKSTFAKHCLWDVGTRVPLIFKGPGIPQNKTIAAPAELLSIYPTLVDLCHLPPNPANEGKSFLPLFNDENLAWEYPAITTYGRGNHSVVFGNYRYIRYDDGSEELYDRQEDPNEWNNLAIDTINRDWNQITKLLQNLLPENDHSWSSYSGYEINEYFRKTSR
ncbi:sulfatase [Membranicola marinus]|uniref:Sulfatase n=1 Tax=Membranihabitans marinus TaxID=1227546 RepID=A0A953HW93_9BACT|nr:sulfatase [Membranihabitans marinus]MBY5959395.1 sulfatase [Membranihabitans marinus]